LQLLSPKTVLQEAIGKQATLIPHPLIRECSVILSYERATFCDELAPLFNFDEDISRGYERGNS